MKRILGILLSISLGLIFIISAITKMIPMEPFEYQFVDIGVATWKTAPYIARIFIGIEFFIGFLLILNIALKKFTLKVSIAFLVFLTGYLIYKIIIDGNAGSCGCFGEALPMSPLEGIIKNIVLIACCIVCYFAIEKEFWSTKAKKVMTPLLFITAMCLGFFVYPIDIVFTSTLDTSKVNYKVPLELMYQETQKEKPSINLLKGKHIIAFLSLSCPHCKIAAKKLHVIHKKNPTLPIYIALNGDIEKKEPFLENTQIADIPHNLFLGPKDWISVAGINLPIIMYVQDGIVIKKFNGSQIEQADMEKWMQQ